MHQHLWMLLLLVLVYAVHARTELRYPRIVWSYYEGVMFDKIERMFNITFNTVCSVWTFRFLTPGNLSLFLDSHHLPTCWHLLTPQTRSDFIRLALLYQYGGWWLDTAVIVSSPTILEKYYTDAKKQEAHLFACCVAQCPRLNIETNFMYAPLGSLFIQQWLEEFNALLSIGRRNYQLDAYRNGVTYSYFLFDGYPKLNIYMSIYVAQQMTLQRKVPRNISLLILNADEVLQGVHN